MIETRQLQFQYPDGPDISFPDISCQAGETLLILGKSGSGKTTLLHLIAGLLSNYQGDITIGSQLLHQLKNSQLDSFRGRNIGLVFQRSHFIQSLSIKENLQLAQHLAGNKIESGRIEAVCQRLSILHLLDRRSHQLSIGEQQRANIARAIINKPQLILADEPTSALDDAHCDEVLHLLKEQAEQEHAALLIVTHDQRLKTVIERNITL